MRQSPLTRRSSLKANPDRVREFNARARANNSHKRAPLRRSRKLRAVEPGEAAWKARQWGVCPLCGAEGVLLRHHVLTEQRVRLAGGDPWDLRNAMLVGAPGVCDCHGAHHRGGGGRIAFSKVPVAAVEFAAETIGAGPATIYFTRRYHDLED